jgi:hypothetical protein
MAGPWATYDERHPWGKPNKNSDIAAISEENLAFATMRREAEKAVRDRTATPEQHAVVADVKRLWIKMREDAVEE